MTNLEDIIDIAVAGLHPVKIGEKPNSPKFDFGGEQALRKTLRTYGEKSLPLIWLLPITPIQLEYGLIWEADVTLNLCTRETNKNLLNVQRLRKSYELTLYPLWKDLQRQMYLTHQVAIMEETVTIQKFPDFRSDFNDIWDVLQIQFTCQFNPKSECLSHKL